jgi:hypothetical protein
VRPNSARNVAAIAARGSTVVGRLTGARSMAGASPMRRHAGVRASH